MTRSTANGDGDLDTLDVSSICRRTGFGRSFIYEAIRRGELRARKFGRLTRVLGRDYRNWLEMAPSIAPAIEHDGAPPRRLRPRAPR